MDNDFNTATVISNLFNYVTLINKAIKEKDFVKATNLVGAIIDIYGVLGLFNQEADLVIESIKNKHLNRNNVLEEDINKMIDDRKEFKANKDYQSADKIRDELLEKGISIKDVGSDTLWDINI